MKLVSFGCSFTFGSELADIRGRRDLQFSHLTWPALIAQRLGWDYQCRAYPGRGNLYIMNSVLAEATTPDPVLFVINWTWIDRFDYFDSQDDSWRSILPNDRDKSAGYYHRYLHSQRRDKLASLAHAVLVLQTLQQRHTPFVMTCMDALMFDAHWHQDAAIQHLQTQLRPHVRDFQGRDFLTWSRANRYPITELWHPLESAHSAAADLMLPLVRSVAEQNTWPMD